MTPRALGIFGWYKLSWLQLAAVAVVANLCLSIPQANGQDKQYLMQGKPISAKAYQAASLVNEAVALMRSNHNQDAADKLSQAVDLAPELSEAHHDLGLALAKLGRLPEAIEQLRTTLTMRDDMDSTWLTLGGLYQSTGQLDEALKTYREFLKRFPGNSEAPKIVNLVKGLENEKKKQLAATQSGISTADDYLADVTAQGMLRWPSERMPLRVYISPGQGVYAYKDDFERILRQAFDDWAHVSNSRVGFVFVNDPSKCDIECTWTSDARKFNNSAEAGETRVFTNQAGIIRGTIKLLTIPLSPDLPLTENRMRVICLHEIGHVLGLAGHTTNPDDIMFYSSSVSDRFKSLSPRDGNTLMRLYSNQFQLHSSSDLPGK